ATPAAVEAGNPDTARRDATAGLTCTVTAADADAWNASALANDAVTASDPTGRFVVVSVTLPSAPTAAVPSTVAPRPKVTVPVGVAGAPVVVATVAVSVTGWPSSTAVEDA